MTIANRAMFVALTQRMWSAASADRSIAQRVEDSYHAGHRSMRVVKQLAPPEKLLPIRRIADFGKAHHEKMTLPGTMKGQQLLATKLFDEYAAAQRDIKDSFYQAVNSFTSIYPEIVETAPRRLGKAFRAEDFPKVEHIASFFGYEHRFAPVPDGENWFLDDLSSEQIDALRNQVENEKNTLFRDAAKELMERTKDVLENVTQQLDTFDGEPGKLRKVTIDAVKEMAELTIKMNLTGDPVLYSVSSEMRKVFKNLDAADLRKDKDERDRTSQITKSLLERLKR